MTAVEFLLERLNRNGLGVTQDEINQANKMFQEQIMNAFKSGDCNGTFETINAEQYYNETFNK
jgi:hypothetical protein